MANSNKTCRGIMSGVDKRTADERADARRKANPELYALLDKVSSGAITIEEAEKELEKING